MGFFSRLKWLFLGEGEAPSTFKPTTTHRHSEQNHPRSSSHTRDRNPRDREGRDSRTGRYSSSREPRDSREPRGDRDRQPRQPYGRDGGGDGRYSSERDRGPNPRRSGQSQGGHSRRDSYSNDGGFPRPIERPSGGPSSTMRPAQSSVTESAPAPAPRVEQQGPEKIGQVTHYFDDAKVASIKIDKGSVRSGDWIEIQGNISSLRQKIDSIQLDNQPIQEAHEGQEVGIRVIRPVKTGDTIIRLRG